MCWDRLAELSESRSFGGVGLAGVLVVLSAVSVIADADKETRSAEAHAIIAETQRIMKSAVRGDAAAQLRAADELVELGEKGEGVDPECAQHAYLSAGELYIRGGSGRRALEIVSNARRTFAETIRPEVDAKFLECAANAHVSLGSSSDAIRSLGDAIGVLEPCIGASDPGQLLGHVRTISRLYEMRSDLLVSAGHSPEVAAVAEGAVATLGKALARAEGRTTDRIARSMLDFARMAADAHLGSQNLGSAQRILSDALDVCMKNKSSLSERTIQKAFIAGVYSVDLSSKTADEFVGKLEEYVQEYLDEPWLDRTWRDASRQLSDGRRLSMLGLYLNRGWARDEDSTHPKILHEMASIETGAELYELALMRYEKILADWPNYAEREDVEGSVRMLKGLLDTLGTESLEHVIPAYDPGVVGGAPSADPALLEPAVAPSTGEPSGPTPGATRVERQGDGRSGIFSKRIVFWGVIAGTCIIAIVAGLRMMRKKTT